MGGDIVAHECPVCGQACYCDIEDVWEDDFEDCQHDCDPQDLQDEEAT